MCGIAGVVGVPGTCEDGEAVGRTFARALAHRGPDGSGHAVLSERRGVLAHTRLAIIDLTDAGAQPMRSDDGRYLLVFNGELYNYRELRRELEGRGEKFRSESDTEVLLHWLIRFGATRLGELDGMFAFALYDQQLQTLLVARDPLGEKPLYYRAQAGSFAFASETRALVAAGLASLDPSPQGIALLLRQGSIPTPWTHLRDVRSLPPATWLRVGPRGDVQEQQRYWRVPFLPRAETITDRREAIERLDSALLHSATLRARADVPVGAFLSGGIDSALVCSLLRRAGVDHLRTFTVALPGSPAGEQEGARAVAKALGTDHTEVPLGDLLGRDWIDDALSAMDVPSIDGANTWLVSRAVREQGLRVACSGVGGDELFWGYPSFDVVPRAHRFLQFLGPLRCLQPVTRPLLRSLPLPPKVGRSLEAVAAGASVAALWFAKRALFTEHEVRELLVESLHAEAFSVDPFERVATLLEGYHLRAKRSVSVLEIGCYLHDQLLRDTDCMSMAHALEVRLPLLSRPVVDLVAQLHPDLFQGPPTKRLLREVLRLNLDLPHFHSPKTGFSLDWSDIGRRGEAETDRGWPAFLRSDAIGRVEAEWRDRTVVPRSFVLRGLTHAFAEESDGSPCTQSGYVPRGAQAAVSGG